MLLSIAWCYFLFVLGAFSAVGCADWRLDLLG